MQLKQFSGRFAVLTALVMGFVVFASPAAQAAYYGSYSDVSATPDTQGTTAAQAFATGPNFSYVVKVRKGNDKAVIYRVDNRSKKRKLMSNATDNRSYNTWLGHANDMTIVPISGKNYFFVVTMNTSGSQLVKLRYEGSKYYKVGSYKLRYKKKLWKASGIDLAEVTGTKVSLLLKSGATVRNASIGLTKNSGTVNLGSGFTLSRSGVKINGKSASVSGYSPQGAFYNPVKDVYYFPLTKGSTSVVLMYRKINTATRGSVKSDTKVSFRITSKKYSKFEIESLGLRNGRLYFNTNRNGNKDAVHVFKGYNAG